MRRSYITSAFAGALLLGLGTTAALAVTGEFNNMCTEGLSSRQRHCYGLLHQCADLRQDLLLREQGSHGRVHEGPDGQHGEGAGLLHKQASWLGCHFNKAIEGPSAYRRRALRAPGADPFALCSWIVCPDRHHVRHARAQNLYLRLSTHAQRLGGAGEEDRANVNDGRQRSRPATSLRLEGLKRARRVGVCA